MPRRRSSVSRSPAPGLRGQGRDHGEVHIRRTRLGDGVPKATPRGRATASAFERAARQVIEEKGFLSATITDIAAAAGKSPGSFYNYYTSKDDLLTIWARRFRDEANERAAGSFDAEATRHDQVRNAVQAHWYTFRDHLAAMIGVSQMAMLDPAFAQEWRSLRQDAVTMIAAWIERSQRKGFCPTLDPLVAASALVAMINQFGFIWLAQDGDGDRTEIDDETAIRTLTDIWYHAMFWQPTEG